MGSATSSLSTTWSAMARAAALGKSCSKVFISVHQHDDRAEDDRYHQHHVV